MAENTITTYICDGCGKQSQSPSFNDGSICGAMHLRYKFSIGRKSYDGSWGGFTTKEELFLCVKCGGKVKESLRALVEQGEKTQ